MNAPTAAELQAATTAIAELLGDAAQEVVNNAPASVEQDLFSDDPLRVAAAVTTLNDALNEQLAAAPADAWEQIGVFRLNCGSAKPQLRYGPIDVAAELAANGVEPTPELLTALAHRKGRAPAVQVIRAAERGQPPTKRLAPATLAAMLRDVGSSMQIQAKTM